MFHEQLQRFELICPARWNPGLLRERLRVGVGDRLEITEDVFNLAFHFRISVCCKQMGVNASFLVADRKQVSLRRATSSYAGSFS